MNYLEAITINLIFLLFPLFLYLLYIAYQQNLNKKENKLFLSIALVSSLYFIIRYGTLKINSTYLSVLYNIPLLISYVKGQKKTAILISAILIAYDTYAFGMNLYFSIIEYVIYYLTYTLIGKKKLNRDYVIHLFLLLKTFFLSIKIFYFLSVNASFLSNFLIVLLSMIVFYLVAYIVFLLFEKGEKIVKLNQTLKELEKEKTLRNSLFKITHEIKNPIAVCKGYLDMLDMNDSKKVNQYIPIVKKEIERTLTLMDDYLDYTKIKIEPEIMDVYYLLEDTIGPLELLCKANGINSKLEIPDDELYLMGDYNRLKQVLMNVLKNAVEAKDETKEEHYIWITTKKNKNTIDIIIQDNGIGMDEETLTHMTEMFYTTKTHGTGLGLALSKEIKGLHHGTIKYSSIEKQETKVVITLPLELKK